MSGLYGSPLPQPREIPVYIYDTSRPGLRMKVADALVPDEQFDSIRYDYNLQEAIDAGVNVHDCSLVMQYFRIFDDLQTKPIMGWQVSPMPQIQREASMTKGMNPLPMPDSGPDDAPSDDARTLNPFDPSIKPSPRRFTSSSPTPDEDDRTRVWNRDELNKKIRAEQERMGLVDKDGNPIPAIGIHEASAVPNVLLYALMNMMGGEKIKLDGFDMQAAMEKMHTHELVWFRYGDPLTYSIELKER